MKRHLPNLTTIVVLIMFFGITSYNSNLTGLYGIRKIKSVNEKIIEQNAKKFKIPMADNYEIDTQYLSYLSSLDTSKCKLRIENHCQPFRHFTLIILDI